MFWISLSVHPNLSRLVAMSIVLGSFSFLPTTSNADQIDLGSLLKNTLDRSLIAEFPEPAFVCKQVSSYRGEKNNLAEKYPDIAKKLGELMDKAWVEPRSQEDDGVYTGREPDENKNDTSKR